MWTDLYRFSVLSYDLTWQHLQWTRIKSLNSLWQFVSIPIQYHACITNSGNLKLQLLPERVCIYVCVFVCLSAFMFNKDIETPLQCTFDGGCGKEEASRSTNWNSRAETSLGCTLKHFIRANVSLELGERERGQRQRHNKQRKMQDQTHAAIPGWIWNGCDDTPTIIIHLLLESCFSVTITTFTVLVK